MLDFWVLSLVSLGFFNVCIKTLGFPLFFLGFSGFQAPRQAQKPQKTNGKPKVLIKYGSHRLCETNERWAFLCFFLGFSGFQAPRQAQKPKKNNGKPRKMKIHYQNVVFSFVFVGFQWLPGTPSGPETKQNQWETNKSDHR